MLTMTRLSYLYILVGGLKIKIDVRISFWKSVIRQVKIGSHLTHDPVLSSIHFQPAPCFIVNIYIDLDIHAAAGPNITFYNSYASMNSSYCFYNLIKHHLPERQP